MENLALQTTSTATQHMYDIQSLIDRFPKEVTLKILDLLVAVRPQIVAIRYTTKGLWSASQRWFPTWITAVDSWNPEPKWKEDVREKYFKHVPNTREMCLGSEIVFEDEIVLTGPAAVSISWANDTIYIDHNECQSEVDLGFDYFSGRLCEMKKWISPAVQSLALPYHIYTYETFNEILRFFPMIKEIFLVMQHHRFTQITNEELKFTPLSGEQESQHKANLDEWAGVLWGQLYPSSRMEEVIARLVLEHWFSEGRPKRAIKIKIVGLKVGDQMM